MEPISLITSNSLAPEPSGELFSSIMLCRKGSFLYRVEPYLIQRWRGYLRENRTQQKGRQAVQKNLRSLSQKQGCGNRGSKTQEIEMLRASGIAGNRLTLCGAVPRNTQKSRSKLQFHRRICGELEHLRKITRI